MEIVNFILVTDCVNFHIVLPIFLFSGAKLGKKEIERDLAQVWLLVILTSTSPCTPILGLLFPKIRLTLRIKHIS